MAWMQVGANAYYYRSKKVGGRCHKEYFGNGPEAHLAAALDAQRRHDVRQQQDARRSERGRWDTAGVVLDELTDLSNLLVRAALLVAGYRQHDRGQWRMKRDGHEN